MVILENILFGFFSFVMFQTISLAIASYTNFPNTN